MGVVSQFMQNPHLDHWNAVMRILRYVKKAPGQGLLYEGDNPQTVKTRLRQWAQVVACAVRQSSDV